MKWVEIISLRCAGNIGTRSIDELLKAVTESDSPTDTPTQLVEIKIYRHPVVETDLSIHIYWKSEAGSQDKSPLGLRFSSPLRNLGLLNHSVWVETSARKFPLTDGNSERRDILVSDRKDISKRPLRNS
jgi:hypothetical protein